MLLRGDLIGLLKALSCSVQPQDKMGDPRAIVRCNHR